MTIQVTKEPINLREKLNELETNKGLKGNEILQAETAQEVRSLIGAGRKNLIINGDFQVSQRGDYTTATTASGSTYYLDRFKTVLGGAFTYTHKISQLVDGKYVNTLLQTMTATGYSATQQFVEDFAKLKGQTVTLSVWVKSNKAGASVGIYDGVSQTHSSPHTGGGGWEKLTVSHTCSTSTTLMRTEVWTTTGAVVGSFIEFTNFQLELGSVATDFEHRSYGEELALCQRYYQKISSNGLVYTTYSTTQGYMQVPTPVQMRVHPSITWETVDRVALASSSNITTNITFWSRYSNYPSSFVSFQARSSVALTSGLTYVMYPTAVKYFSFDAEL